MSVGPDQPVLQRAAEALAQLVQVFPIATTGQDSLPYLLAAARHLAEHGQPIQVFFSSVNDGQIFAKACYLVADGIKLDAMGNIGDTAVAVAAFRTPGIPLPRYLVFDPMAITETGLELVDGWITQEVLKQFQRGVAYLQSRHLEAKTAHPSPSRATSPRL